MNNDAHGMHARRGVKPVQRQATVHEYQPVRCRLSRVCNGHIACLSVGSNANKRHKMILASGFFSRSPPSLLSFISYLPSSSSLHPSSSPPTALSDIFHSSVLSTEKFKLPVIMNENHPSCVHSTSHHNSVSISSSQSASAGGCSCEDCAPFKAPSQQPSEQLSSFQDLQQQQHHTQAAPVGPHDRNPSSSSISSTSPPTTYLARRPSVPANSATSPRMQPAGFGGGGSATQMSTPHRRASLEFHNRERSFQQHSTACDCRGSGVGCGCAFTCDC